MPKTSRARFITGVIFTLCLMQSTSARADETHNSQVVFCLSGSHREALIEAAENLGLVKNSKSPSSIVRGSETFKGEHSVEEWKNKHPADFEESCSALVQATAMSEGTSPPDSSKWDFLTWLLPILAGSVLTILATELQSVKSRRLTVADSIRSTTSAFREALIDYTTEWTHNTTGGAPSSAALDKQRTQLMSALRKVGLGRKWPFLEKLTNELDGPHFRNDLKNGWNGTLAERQEKSEKIQSRMTRVEADAEQVATMSTSIFPLFLKPGRKKTPTSLGNS
ncbi:hypothetical protein [Streptomyces sp. NPDC002599]|uniref:hypothetical protein n=1 Tax=Streptomyces sp. NPDC002599 TaxID=3154421 RepID=UPI00331E6790